MSPPVSRPCGCPLHAADHLEPEPDWIGNVPIIHGERDDDPRPAAERQRWPSPPCLCGHPCYLTCPEAWGGSVADLVIGGTLEL